MLVIIGPQWPGSFTGEKYATDWVRVEIARALSRKIPVIPILLSGVTRLKDDCLPSDLAGLSRLQYLRFDYRNTEQDLIYIATELRRVVPALDKGGSI
jgi:hypothetical protein